MKKIGFANTFYTLWDVTTENVYATFNGQHYLSHTKTNFFYIQNLSIDEVQAIKKAASMGCTDLTPDEELRGQSKSFERVKSFEKPAVEAFQFAFGKYELDDIRDSNDLTYLLWYFRETGNSFAAQRAVELDDSITFEGGELITQTDRVYADLLAGKYELTAVSNFSIDAPEQRDAGLAYVKVIFDAQTDAEAGFLDSHPYGVKLELNTDGLELVQKSYRGFEYYTPKGSRSFKNTQFKLKNNKIEILN